MRNKKGNVLVFLLAGILIVSVGVTGYFFIQNRELQNQVTTATSASPTPTPVSTVEDMTGWKTYTNTKYGFKLIYPGRGGIVTENYDPNLRGECGKAIKEDQVIDGLPAIWFDNFFYIIVKKWTGTIKDYIRSNSAEGVYNLEYLDANKSNADEVVKMGSLVSNSQVYPPMAYVSHLYRKGNILLILMGLQNPGNFGGCAPSSSEETNQWLNQKGIKFL